jgi:hypothetical protein
MPECYFGIVGLHSLKGSGRQDDGGIELQKKVHEFLYIKVENTKEKNI